MPTSLNPWSSLGSNAMKLFEKIFVTVLVIFAGAFIAFSFLTINRQIATTEKNIIEQNSILGSYITKEIQVGYAESRWPFENLKQLSGKNDFLFWWIVKGDNQIYLADKEEFMGTNAYSYFPEIQNIKTGEKTIVNHPEDYGIYVQNYEAGKSNWKFILGFSLKEVSLMRKETYIVSAIFVLATVIISGILLYIIVAHFTKPIQELVTGTKIISEGNLSYQLPTKTNDEIGDLAKAFNLMTVNLKQFYSGLEELVKKRTSEVEESKKQLEKNITELQEVNKLMVGRELKMAEMKKEIEELKEQLHKDTPTG
jgi:HAMP domain-containing protein